MGRNHVLGKQSISISSGTAFLAPLQGAILDCMVTRGSRRYCSSTPG